MNKRSDAQARAQGAPARSGAPSASHRVAARVVWVIGGLLAALVVAGVALMAYRNVLAGQWAAENAGVVEKLQGELPGSSPSMQSADLLSVQVDGISYVGILNLPALDTALPVTASWSEGQHCPGVVSGSVSSGNLVISGPNLKGCFEGIERVPDGEKVSLQLADGSTETYEVVSGETLSASDDPSLVKGADDWDLTLYCSSVSSTQLDVLRLRKER